MTDTELLELAAKAAGYSFDGYVLRNNNTEFEYSGWNPLEDDGDAFRLAVSLGLTVVVETDMVFCRNQNQTKYFENNPKIAVHQPVKPSSVQQQKLERQ